MKLCRTCGAPMDDEATFCPMCGTLFSENGSHINQISKNAANRVELLELTLNKSKLITAVNLLLTFFIVLFCGNVFLELKKYHILITVN